MATTFFDSISHADFLRLTLEAFTRQGFKVEPSRDAGADSVLVGGKGERIGLLCKKYRGAFIGRPVLQQFHGAMRALKCKEGYLVTTTDCSPDACEFAVGKRIVLYNGERTTELLRAAFGDELIRKGKMPELGKMAKAAPPAARQPVSAAAYEKVAAPVLKKASEPVRALESAPSSNLMQAPAPVQASEPVRDPLRVQTPEPARASEAEQVSEPEKAEEPVPAPQEKAAIEELPEEVQEVEELQEPPVSQEVQSPAAPEAPTTLATPEAPGIPEAAPSERSTIIVCLECNKQLQVPIDQGMITVQCPECGMRRVYQPELNEAGELRTTTVISCPSCKQKLNVPTNRGQLNVRCPQCRAAWVYTP